MNKPDKFREWHEKRTTAYQKLDTAGRIMVLEKSLSHCPEVGKIKKQIAELKARLKLEVKSV